MAGGLAGGSPNLRLVEPDPMPNGADVTVECSGPSDDVPQFDDSGALLKIEHGDGSVTLTLDGRPIQEAAGQESGGWFQNLAEKIDAMEMARISDDLLRGIADDESSRREWIENLATGLRIMGLFLEMPQTGAGTDSAPIEGMSRIRHPLLQEAVLRFQANARSELLPTDGPVKIRNDNNNSDSKEDDLANDLQSDLNHFLTFTASEYYPDTDRMLLKLGFGGTTFKKVYKCPIRNRPVSETVSADDLIVHAEATDLRNARRITHRTTMRPSVVRRMQLLGVYRDVAMSTPAPRQLDSLQREERNQAGASQGPTNPEDRDREIYECYCELSIKGFEHRYKGKESGLDIPYRVTIDVTSKEILSIVRNYNEDDKELPEAKMRFVKYTFIPGFGFYDIGLLHILGNTTNAITAAWRELLDAGMFSNFPGFLIAKSGSRQNTNIFRVPPGGGAQVDTGGVNIRDAIMPLPYQPPSQALMQLVDNIAETGQRIGGTAELQVGEGKADMPVGTTIALIEQATKLVNSVHKRLHASQAEEFQLLKQCFRENPECFWQRPGRSGKKWDEETFLKALNDYNLVPQADPNTSSYSQRVLKVQALKTLQAGSPNLYDARAVEGAAIRALGWGNPDEFLASPEQASQPTPEVQEAIAKNQNDKIKADASMVSAQAKEEEVKAKIAQGAFAQKHEGPEQSSGQQDTQADLMGAQAKLMDAHTRQQQAGLQAAEAHTEDQNRDQDRESREKLSLMETVRDIMMHPDVPPEKAASEGKAVAKKLKVSPKKDNDAS